MWVIYFPFKCNYLSVIIFFINTLTKGGLIPCRPDVEGEFKIKWCIYFTGVKTSIIYIYRENGCPLWAAVLNNRVLAQV